MTTPPTRFQSAWRRRWMITLVLVLLPALTFAWWGQTDYPDTFPSLVEDLDRQAWVIGAETLLPDRYQQFHTHVLELRSQWRTEANHWWTTGDAEQFNRTYQQLVEEGSLLIEASRQTIIALRLEVEELLQPEQAQLTRLRALSHVFDLEDDMLALSLAEGLLRESVLRLEEGQYLQARSAGEQAIEHLRRVEAHVVTQMNRYTNEVQIARWEEWVTQTLQRSVGTAVIVLKAPRRLLVYQHGRVVADYPARVGFSGLTDKLYEGDGATPEGQFRVMHKKEGSGTIYYKALLLDYPTIAHQQRFHEAKAKGLMPQDRSIGGLIEIHGEDPNNEETTSGCIALENSAMDDVFEWVNVGTPVTIVGALNQDNDVVTSLHQLKVHIHERNERWHKPRTLASSFTRRE
ncbi:L,D-transpeptidase family protein [Candidatus Nitrospira allomarina]|uniref:L,D-transpeptidase n=1 Tax=Candidatus Nitrospira allomarina TaxID=3020900 RepID=A0AA96G9G1_9BACT|nr:L,D-transpeptidase [Candidatus Nitrospira allomarina]WNM57864.1 L,D-transpeptidase [Candidatus Nitrospira allomarina]